MSRHRHVLTALKALALIALVPVVCIGLGLARAAVLMVPFPKLSRRFGQSLGAVAMVPLASSMQMRMANLVGRAIRKVAPYTPWDSNCLAQAVLARVLLGVLRIPYALHFGLRPRVKAQDEPIAHAWVVCGRVFVTGGNGFLDYPVVAVFVPAGLVLPVVGATPISSPAISVSR